jgi:hypothetical protein
MQIHFIKTSHQMYTLECVLKNGQKVSRSLESKSYLRHDLMHYVVESEARLQNSFFGGVASGDPLIMDKSNTDTPNPEIIQTEMVVSILQSMDKRPDISPSDFLQRIKLASEIRQEPSPDYATFEFIQRIQKRYMWLTKQLQSLKTGPDQMLSFEWEE